MSFLTLLLRMGIIHTPIFFFSSRRRHTRLQGDWSSDVCSSDLKQHINTPIKFRRMEIEEMVVVADILEKLFETHPNIPQWQDRIRANPEIGFVVKIGRASCRERV